MLARALMPFSGLGIMAHKGDFIEILNEKTFLDLYQAGFVEQVDRISKDQYENAF